MPVKGFKKPGGGFTSSPTIGFKDLPMTVACGRCIGCRMDRSREWATRIAHEASLHEENCFLTLTFSDEHLPEDYSVRARDLQLFMKRFRKAISPTRLRFFACGEYGENNGRPHYHAIIFGFAFPDKTVWRRSPSGHLCYRSALLEQLWPFGHAEIGTVTKESGGYVARYVIKKVGGPSAPDHYQRVHSVTGEICWVNPEFACCSTRPGIGAGYADTFGKDAYPSGFLVQEGQKVAIPKYYARRIKSQTEEHGSDPRSGVSAADVEKVRKTQVKKTLTDQFKQNSTRERLAVREEVQLLRLDRLKRDLDNGNPQ